MRRIGELPTRIAGSGLADRTAGASVEFALIAPLLIALTLGAIQLGLIFFASCELDRITDKAARDVMLGTALGQTASEFQAAVCANVAVLFNCNGLIVNLTPQGGCAAISTTPPVLTYDANGNLLTQLNYNPGMNGSIMVLQVMYQLPVIAGPLLSFANADGSVLVISTKVFANEP